MLDQRASRDLHDRIRGVCGIDGVQRLCDSLTDSVGVHFQYRDADRQYRHCRIRDQHRYDWGEYAGTRRAVWESLTFILNGFVFVLIFLQLPGVMAGVGELSRPRVILYGVVFSVFLIALRLVWTFPGAYVAHFVRTRLLHQDEPRPGVRGIFVVGWTGMRE
jgi:hypothetical protein